jgi:hypothetical protein
MKKAAAVLICLASLCLASCKEAVNTFKVRDVKSAVHSAEVQLCGKRIVLTKTDEAFAGNISINCEASGVILVRLANGREITCPIGYVTTGANQAFEFEVEDGTCRPVSAQNN